MKTQSLIIVDPVHAGEKLARYALEAGFDVLPLFTVPRRMVSAELLRDLNVKNTFFDTDLQRLIRVVKHEMAQRDSKVAGVIAGSEPAVETAAQMAARFSVPGLEVESAFALRNKDEMRARLAAKGRPGPDFRVCTSPQAARDAASAIGFPLVCKRPSGAGGCGVAMVRDARDLDAYLTQAFNENIFGQTTDRILCESFLPGDEYVVDLFADGAGNYAVLGVFRYVYFKGFIKNIYRSVDETSEFAKALIAEAQASCAALGMTLGPVHCELKMEVGGRPVLVETGARLPGGGITEIYCRSNDMNLYAMTIEAFIQGHFDLTKIKKTPRHVASVFPSFEIEEDVGVLTALDGRDWVERLASFQHFTQDKQIGDTVQSNTNLNDQWINVLLAHDDAEQLDRDIVAVLNLLCPVTAPINDALKPFFDAGMHADELLSGTRALQPYLNNVTGFSRRIPGVIKPTSATQIETIVQVANQTGTAIFPFSTGKNWSLGSKLPNADDTVLLDLGYLDRLLEVDPDQGFARFEPGCTQGMLVDHLALHHPNHMINVTGGHGGLSMMGNCLDRGDGFYGPRHDDALGFKVVLGNANTLRVGGFWAEDHPDRNADLPSHFHRWGVGPDLKDLMFQSNFGIATEMVFRVMDRQEKTVLFWATGDREHLFDLVDIATKAIRSKICEEGNSRVGIELDNARGEADPLKIDSIVPRGQVIFNTIVSGQADVVDAQVRALLSRYRACGHFTVQHLVLTQESVEDLSDMPEFIKLIAPMSLGHVVWRRIEPAYENAAARPSHPSLYDLDQTYKGMLGCLPAIPMRHPKLVVDCVALIERVCQHFDLDPVIALEMAGIGMAKLFFDTRVDGQVERAQACKAEMHRQMIAAGFIPHRADIEEQANIVAARLDYFVVVADLKRALDPNGIIAPGRYSTHSQKAQTAFVADPAKLIRVG